MECLTDSANRTSQTVRHAVSRGGGKMADPGSVLFSFQRKGVILIPDPNAEEQVGSDSLKGRAAVLFTSPILCDEPGSQAAQETCVKAGV